MALSGCIRSTQNARDREGSVLLPLLLRFVSCIQEAHGDCALGSYECDERLQRCERFRYADRKRVCAQHPPASSLCDCARAVPPWSQTSVSIRFQLLLRWAAHGRDRGLELGQFASSAANAHGRSCLSRCDWLGDHQHPRPWNVHFEGARAATGRAPRRRHHNPEVTLADKLLAMINSAR
jgi:hypothetical protein